MVILDIEDDDNFNKTISERLNTYEDNINPDYKITGDEYRMEKLTA